MRGQISLGSKMNAELENQSLPRLGLPDKPGSEIFYGGLEGGRRDTRRTFPAQLVECVHDVHDSMRLIDEILAAGAAPTMAPVEPPASPARG
jgi:hypothetical protein